MVRARGDVSNRKQCAFITTPSKRTNLQQSDPVGERTETSKTESLINKNQRRICPGFCTSNGSYPTERLPAVQPLLYNIYMLVGMDSILKTQEHQKLARKQGPQSKLWSSPSSSIFSSTSACLSAVKRYLTATGASTKEFVSAGINWQRMTSTVNGYPLNLGMNTIILAVNITI